MVCSTSVFDDVGASAGRGMGGHVTCPRPLPWRYPTGFAGVCFATVTGLVVWWLVRGLLVDVLWPWWVSMGWAFRVFDDVGASAGRGSGRVAGRGWGRWRGLSACSSMFEVVGGCVGRRLGRLVACWLTTFVVFEGVGGGTGRRLGRRGRRGCLLVDDFCVFKGVVALIGSRRGRLGRRGCVLVDDFCGGGVGFSSVRDCGWGFWSSSRSSWWTWLVVSRSGEASLGGVRLRSRLWVVGVTRKDV